MIIQSHVVDARKPITSRTGVGRAKKARTTLETAKAIMQASGHDLICHTLQGEIDQLTRQMRTYYDGPHYRGADQ